jgi:two-component system, cell cycle sensor histidine kinase and response regulator CckA
LVVDDEVGVRQMAARYLRDAGYSVVEAADGLQAWQYFQRQPSQVDGVVADAVMPRMTGTDLAARLLGARPELPIVLMSGYTPADLLARGLEASLGELLTKPFSRESLLAVVRRALGSADSTKGTA